MKKIIFSILLFIVFVSCGNDKEQFNQSDIQLISGSVYICTGPSSKAYHKTKNCKGLRNCSKEIISVTLDEAKNMNRKPCGYCYK